MPRPTPCMLAALLAAVACHTDTAAPPGAASAAGADTAMPQATAHELTPIGDVLWHTDYDAAVEVARAEGKPLWVHFGEDPG